MERKNEEGLTEKEFLAQYRPGDYERPSVTVDILIFAVDQDGEEAELLPRQTEKPSLHRPVGNSRRFCESG